jgi:hypothetical protein
MSEMNRTNVSVTQPNVIQRCMNAARQFYHEAYRGLVNRNDVDGANAGSTSGGVAISPYPERLGGGMAAAHIHNKVFDACMEQDGAGYDFLPTPQTPNGVVPERPRFLSGRM